MQQQLGQAVQKEFEGSEEFAAGGGGGVVDEGDLFLD